MTESEAAPVVPSDELLEWPKKDMRWFLHVVYRVGDLHLTIKFYTEGGISDITHTVYVSISQLMSGWHVKLFVGYEFKNCCPSRCREHPSKCEATLSWLDDSVSLCCELYWALLHCTSTKDDDLEVQVNLS